jgi:hypothetical protein
MVYKILIRLLFKNMQESAVDSMAPWYCSWWAILVLINAVSGLAVFEWAWYSLRRFRSPN